LEGINPDGLIPFSSTIFRFPAQSEKDHILKTVTALPSCTMVSLRPSRPVFLYIPVKYEQEHLFCPQWSGIHFC